MKYFFLKESVRTIETGNEYPQIQKMSTMHDFDDDNGVYVFSRITFPQNNPNLKFLLLEEQAKLTDLLSSVMLILTGLLINNKVKDLLSNFNIPNHKFYPAFVKDIKDNVYAYYWIQTSDERDVDFLLNYSESEFYIRKDTIGIEKEPVKINSIEDLKYYQSKLEIHQGIRTSKAVLNKSFLSLNLDLFKVGRFSTYWIVTERLKNAFEKEKITGVSFTEAKNLTVSS
jgi:hypothetical protein